MLVLSGLRGLRKTWPQVPEVSPQLQPCSRDLGVLPEDAKGLLVQHVATSCAVARITATPTLSEFLDD